MKLIYALVSGFIGAAVLNLLHETVRRLNPDAPRMDILGMRVLARSMRKVDVTPPPEEQLQGITLIGDIVSNSLYYSLIGIGSPDSAWIRGTLLGLLAGIGGVTLPGPLGLGTKPSARTGATAAMTVGWYLAGGLAAAAAMKLLAKNEA